MTAYIWDLDGTLLDSYGVIVEAAARTAADEGINDPKDYILKVVKQKSCTAYMEEIGSQCGKTVREEAGAVHFVYTHRGSSSEPILERLGVLKCFREVVTSMYGFAPKPSGEGVRFLVEKYGLDPEQTWYVGDRTLDVLCAKDAGVKALLYLAPDTCVEATGKEDRIVQDLREIDSCGK